MLPRSLRLSLYAAQLVAFLTLLRSIAFDRWITVLASVILFAAASAAHRGKSWGVGVMFGQAVAFATAWAVGIAPPWFVLVGLIGALPAILTTRALARFDKGATAILGTFALAAGALGAIGWKAIAWSIFEAFPSTWPSAYPHHGLLLALLAAGGAAAAGAAMRKENSANDADEGVRVRVGENVRIAHEEEEAHEEAAAEPGLRMRRPLP